MKPSFAWMLVATVLITLGSLIVFHGRSAAPPAELLSLEVTSADFAETDSCYPLSSLLSVNRLDGSNPGVDIVWTRRKKDEWTLRVERGRSWSAYSFQRKGERLLPVRVAFSDNQPQLGPREAIAALLRPAINQDKPLVARCGGPGPSLFF